MKRLLILLVLTSYAVQAEIYKSQNEKGEWVYSDKPSPSAERLKLPPLSTYSPPARVRGTSSTTEPESEDVYKSMVFVEPEMDATFRDNEGLVQAKLKLEPSLKSAQGHKIQFFLDGKAYGAKVGGTGIVLKNVERGTHVLDARVLNSTDGFLFRAAPVTFYVHRQSLNNSNRPGVPTPAKRKK